MKMKPTIVPWSICFVLACAGWWATTQIGCGKKASTVDSAPFLQAVNDYLNANRMELKVKDVKEGPVVDQDHATMTASLVHAELGGPAVTWDLQFERQSDGTWKVLEHAVAK